MKLVAFSYAGGDGHVFLKMKKELMDLGIEVIPYMYRGRCIRTEQHSDREYGFKGGSGRHP